jgi:hypothetical protein
MRHVSALIQATRDRVTRIRVETSGVAYLYNISSRDGDFLNNLANQPYPATSKQLRWLEDIEKKVFPPANKPVEESTTYRPMRCPKCNGAGEVHEFIICLNCHGAGEI